MLNLWRWTLPYWLGAVALFVLVWIKQWGPEPSGLGALTLHTSTSGVEMLLIQLLLGGQRHPLAMGLIAVLLATVATGFWALKATPTGPGVTVAHVVWLMLLVVVLAGRLGWALFGRILTRRRTD